jgi:hypothetical protein
MRKCPYCGLENSDDAVHCITCHTELVPAANTPTSKVMPPEEQRFWARLTLRDAVILVIKLQALWVLFPVLIELTYLRGYFSEIFPARRFDLLPPDMRESFNFALLRIGLRLVVGLGVFVYADRLLSWLARGLINRRAEEGGANGSQPVRPETSSTSVAAGSRRSP